MEYLTKQGLKKLQDELKDLKTVKRKEIAERLRETAAFGDLSENSEYLEAREKQAFTEGRISELEDLLRDAVVVEESAATGGGVRVGSKIVVMSAGKKETLTIVGVNEVNSLEGKISPDSPLGKALLGRGIGDTVVLNMPAGRKLEYKIIRIS